jgi:hypothetical protein
MKAGMTGIIILKPNDPSLFPTAEINDYLDSVYPDMTNLPDIGVARTI